MLVFITLCILSHFIPSYHNHIIKTKRPAVSAIIPATPGASIDIPLLPALFVTYVGADCITVFVKIETEPEMEVDTDVEIEDETEVEVVPGLTKEMMMAPSPLSAVFVVILSPDSLEVVFFGFVSVGLVSVRPICVVLVSVFSGPNIEMMIAPRLVPVIAAFVPPTTTCVPLGGSEYTVPEIVIAGPPAMKTTVPDCVIAEPPAESVCVPMTMLPCASAVYVCVPTI